MKKPVLLCALLLSVLSFALTSCEKEKPLSEAMIGKWEVEYYTEYIYKNNVLFSEYKEYLPAGELAIKLIAGGDGIYYEGENEYLFSWNLNGTSLTIPDLYEETVVWDIRMEGDKLVWSYGGTDSEDPTITWKISFTANRVN